jgi:putative hydrolase of the HAD superfamily
VKESDIEEARKLAISSWAPSFTKAVLWHFLKPDTVRTQRVYQRAIEEIFTHRDDVVLMDGVADLIPKLAQRYVLGLAGNQPEYTKEKLERTGLMKYFKSTLLSSDLELYKPDSRFFLEICAELGVKPENCCMVGDRLDNDIYPANVLKMRTIWVQIGPHAVQHPRVPEDVPDATVEHMSDVGKIIAEWEHGVG